ncbi:hypothetical protein [Methylobacterium nonmethylotrophicum]|uniref:Uncharacterized protein n=1 Tax=Methylobacterium nonmethylotrophicum TaxID=1141884 RepID=A0A4Z0NIE9_9HYPH|nr:hypothetical protein [Methylobacterium nonmethylotrophicum]TGD95356.1 hypothetical protein EU555_28480 [Methylobacterium nonmethylotrophicum]
MRAEILELMRVIAAGIAADEMLAANISELSLKFRHIGKIDDAGMLHTLSEFHRYNAVRLRDELADLTDKYLMLCDDGPDLSEA